MSAEKTKHQPERIILGLTKATHHRLAGKTTREEPHVLSPRGKEVLSRVAAAYGAHRAAGNEVHVIFAGRAPNYDAAQRQVPGLDAHAVTVPQAEMFKQEAAKLNVPEEHITALSKGTDLMWNLIYLRRHLGAMDNPPKVIEIHVDGYQASRAAMVARHVLRGYKIEMRPAFVERTFGGALFEEIIYEPIEKAYMWAGSMAHRIFAD
jgi:hypothetical protein